VPFRAGWQKGSASGFGIVEIAKPDSFALVFTGDTLRWEGLDSQRQVDSYMRVFDHLERVALPSAESLELFDKMAAQLGAAT
jgi:hypothetical protein